MTTLTRQSCYLPDPSEIARMAAEIHDENILREFVAEDEGSRIDRRGGPRLLLLSIVKKAVTTLEEWGRRYKNFRGRTYEFWGLQRDAQRAYRFLMSDDQEFVTCFRSICDETGADADAIRELALTRTGGEALQALFDPSTRMERKPG